MVIYKTGSYRNKVEGVDWIHFKWWALVNMVTCFNCIKGREFLEYLPKNDSAPVS
jgi:hypothetical protein